MKLQDSEPEVQSQKHVSNECTDKISKNKEPKQRPKSAKPPKSKSNEKAEQAPSKKSEPERTSTPEKKQKSPQKPVSPAKPQTPEKPASPPKPKQSEKPLVAEKPSKSKKPQSTTDNPKPSKKSPAQQRPQKSENKPKLTSSLRKSQDRENSSSKKSVKFEDSELPKGKPTSKEPIIITDSIEDPKSKIFVIKKASKDSKNFETNNFYDKEEKTESKELTQTLTAGELSRIASDPKLRIIAPDFDWDPESGKKESHSRQKSADVNVFKESATRQKHKPTRSEINQRPETEYHFEVPENSHMTPDDRDDVKNTKSSRFEESDELLKSIYEFNKSSRSQ